MRPFLSVPSRAPWRVRSIALIYRDSNCRQKPQHPSRRRAAGGGSLFPRIPG
ncbi:hypothetical protein E2C01_073111 [Portunus trituberculatus]|uniref:Uncharacterized protein n=1 Tax=Portunus trituberculatus TaxID=210409 RepID=A0A5B7I9Q3_PORTR|nr:hypothetical protein [Portunus trituberculatus]